MRLVFLPRAVEDLVWFRLYYERILPDGAKRAGARYRRTLDLIEASPHIGPPLLEGKLREHAIPQTPFSLVYRVRADRIEVLRVWDQRAERTQEWLSD